MGGIHEVKHSLRRLAKAPSFTLLMLFIIVGSLTVSMVGFNYVYTVTVKPLDSEREQSVRIIRQIRNTVYMGEVGEPRFVRFHHDEIKRLEQSGVLDEMGEFTYVSPESVWLSTGTVGEEVQGMSVSKEFSSFSGVKAILGRALKDSDYDPSNSPVVVISHWVWQHFYAGREEVIGKRVTIDGVPTTIVGVMPEGYRFPTFSHLWKPDTGSLSESNQIKLYFRARSDEHEENVRQLIAERMTDELKASVSQIQREMVTPVEVRSLSLVEESTDSMGIKIMLASLLLVIAVVVVAAINISNLLLAQSLKYQRESAIRAALGASKSRVVGQLASDGLLLCVVGLSVSLLLTSLTLEGLSSAITALIGSRLPYWWHWQLDIATSILAGCLTLIIILVAVIYPANKTANFNISDILRDGTRGAVSKINTVASKRMLGIQLGVVSFLIMVGSLVVYLMTSVISSTDLEKDKGFYTISLERSGAEEISQELQIALRERLSTNAMAPMIDEPILRGAEKIDTRIYQSQRDINKRIRTTFISTLDADRLIRGQNFGASDHLNSERVAIINSSLANEIFGSLDVIGNRIEIGPLEQEDSFLEREYVRIIGLAEDSLISLTADTDHRIYLPLSQSTSIPWLDLSFRSQDINQTMTFIQRSLKAMDQQLIVTNIFDHYQNRRAMLATFGLSMGGIAIIGGFSLFMALIGIYGMARSQVNQARYEIGLRRALGSTDRRVVWLMINKNMHYVGLGIGIATAIFAACGFVGYQLFQGKIPVSMFVQSGFFTFIGLAAVVVLALYIPVREVLKQTPSASLRMD
ncbi:ABC transporter permease [Veronia pacifica]|uniref:Permease n=1 Tax=Veronia pacifica TaxID=1080227 RepID=A0A1C3EP93_9GAMM|nr:ABC transporter permease [Veronia pacifica]ODA35060.1 hypothetical protein A8L45_05115 [Veronia pacifica]